MSEQRFSEGTFDAVPVSWGVQEIEQLDGKLKAVIQFQILETNQKITWSDFFKKRDGTDNKKTVNTLKACGFKGPLHTFTDDNALDRSTPVKIDIVREVRPDGREFYKVEWVNAKDQAGFDMLDPKSAAQKLRGLQMDFGAPPAKTTKRAAPRNYAEEIPMPEERDELPF